MANKDFNNLKDKELLGVDVEKVEQIQPSTTNNELMDFDKAFRIFKKTKLQAQKWDSEAVLVFAKKKNPNKLNSLDSWVEIFNKY